MPIQQPGGGLWGEVSKFTTWPDSNEDAIRAMSTGWLGGGDHFTQASTFDLDPMTGGWADRAGQVFHGRATEHMQTMADTGARMAELAGRADAYAGEVTGVKNGIHALMAANEAGYAQAAAMPAPALENFARQVAGMVDTMMAEAAGRIAGFGTPTQEQPPPGPANPEDPLAVSNWWKNELTDPQRAYLIAHPESIRNLDGIPADIRDKANEQVLGETITALRQQEATAPGSTGGRLAALEDLQRRAQDPNLFLLGFKNDGDGQAIVSIGNPDTAKNVATLVPGITNELNNIGFQIDRAGTLVTPGTDTAAIVWLDYNPPEALPIIGGGNSLTPLVQDRAIAGSQDFAQFQNGLRVTHLGDASHNVVIGHSYGTTVAGIAAREYGLNADQLVLLASTDPGVQNVGQINLINADGSGVPADQVPQRVLASTTDDDFFAHSSTWLLSNDPSDSGFGARTYTTPSHPGDQHSAAFYPEGLEPLKRIIIGQEP